jgi:hypothetical protein
MLVIDLLNRTFGPWCVWRSSLGFSSGLKPWYEVIAATGLAFSRSGSPGCARRRQG